MSGLDRALEGLGPEQRAIVAKLGHGLNKVAIGVMEDCRIPFAEGVILARRGLVTALAVHILAEDKTVVGRMLLVKDVETILRETIEVISKHEGATND